MKTVLVIGGTGKIGSNLALHFSEMNYEVAITYFKSKEKLEDLQNEFKNIGKNLISFQCDLSQIKNIDELFNQFIKKFNSLDVLINCAGVFTKNTFKETTESEFEQVFNINLKSIYFIIQRFSEVMSNKSVVVNFASVGGIIPWKNRSLYHISKAGVIALTKSLALELAPKTRVISIAPGYIELNENENENEKMPLSKIPLNRYGRIENITQTIDFILANDYITGITIPVDGGRTLI